MTTATGPIKKMNDLGPYLKAREVVRTTFNEKLAKLQAKMKIAADNNKEMVLFSIPLNETLITLGGQTLDNLFSSVKEHYPEHGLFLREIEIVHREYIGDAGSSYYTNIVIRFKFDKEEFNTHWSYFSLNRLSFNDEKYRFSDNSMGVCLDPTFVDKERYELAKTAVLKAREELSGARK